MGFGVEDKILCTGLNPLVPSYCVPLHLQESGTVQELVHGACALMCYKVAVLLSGPGPSPDDGDVEISALSSK